MTKAQGYFEAKKHAFRQTQDGVVISFTVHPQEVPQGLALAQLGTRYMVAFAAIGDDEKPLLEPKQEKAKTPFNQMSRAQQAGILCADKKFQIWLGVGNEKTAAEHVREVCGGVASRSELDNWDVAAQSWDSLVSRYRMATGQQAEMRS